MQWLVLVLAAYRFVTRVCVCLSTCVCLCLCMCVYNAAIVCLQAMSVFKLILGIDQAHYPERTPYYLALLPRTYALGQAHYPRTYASGFHYPERTP